MTPAARYRAVAALSSLEGLAHALRLALAAGRDDATEEALGRLTHDLEAVTRAVTVTPGGRLVLTWRAGLPEVVRDPGVSMEIEIPPKAGR
jgi:predicted DCC family thiol-disulfide oxidoreductase YuxK